MVLLLLNERSERAKASILVLKSFFEFFKTVAEKKCSRSFFADFAFMSFEWNI